MKARRASRGGGFLIRSRRRRVRASTPGSLERHVGLGRHGALSIAVVVGLDGSGYLKLFRGLGIGALMRGPS